MAKRSGAKPTPPKQQPQADSCPVEATPAARLHLWQIQAVRDVLFVAAVIAVFWVGYLLRAVTVPLLVALLLAYLFEPVINYLCVNSRLSRARAVGLLLAIVTGGLLIVLAIVIPLVVGQTMQVVDDVRNGEVREKISKVSSFIPERYQGEFTGFLDLFPRGPAFRMPVSSTPPEGDDAATTDQDVAVTEPQVDPRVTEQRVGEMVAEQIATLRKEMVRTDAGEADWSDLSRGGAIARGGGQAIFRAIAVVLGVGLLTFLIPFYFFFFSLWYPDVVAFGRSLVPEKNRSRTTELLGKMNAVVSGFVRGRIIISMIMGVLLAFGWMLCDVPYSIVLGLIVGVFCAVPYLGGIGVPIAVGLLFFDKLGGDHGKFWWVFVMLWPTVVFVIVQLIEGYVLTPMIAGKATNLDPVTILVAVLAGGSVMGVYGMLLAIPAAACLKILFTDVLLPRIQAWTRGEVADPLPIDRT